MPAARSEATRPQTLSLPRGFLIALYCEMPLVGAILAYAAFAALLVIGTGATHALAFSSYLGIWSIPFFFVFPTLYLGTRMFWVVHRVDRRRRLALRSVFPPLRMRQFATGMVLLLALMFFQGGFTSIKAAMPFWQSGFPHDEIQANLDRALHFGSDPWRYLFAVTDARWLQRLVEWNYSQGWFLSCFGFLFWMAVSPRAAQKRTRYMATYVATWAVIGNLLAFLFLSAGPAYYGAVTGDTARFAGQMALLERGAGTMHSAVGFQAYLWSLYENATAGIGSGISAFPSMHVGLATLNALFLAEFGRRYALIGVAYVVVIQLSSVYLAWHYAIDGYAAILVAGLLYLAMRKLLPDAGRGRSVIVS